MNIAEKKINHLDVMISVKTLGLDSSAIMTSVGAVMFDPTGKTNAHLENKNQFYVTVSNVDSSMNGFKVDPVTLKWMKYQKGISQISSELMSATTSVAAACNMLIEFFEKNEPNKYWANSPRFHFSYLEGVCEKLDIKIFFNNQKEMDYRTIMECAYVDRENRPAHNELIAGYPQQHALGDAIMQSENIIVARREIGLNNGPANDNKIKGDEINKKNKNRL